MSNLSKGEPEFIGALTGTFYSLHYLSALLGYIFVLIFLKFSQSTTLIFLSLFLISIISVIMFFFLTSSKMNEENEVVVNESLKDKLYKIYKSFYNMKLFLLIPYTVYQGLSISFQNGVFTKILGINLIPYVFLCYGVSIMIGSFTWGRICIHFI
jgi:membrane-associated HD superfamily phosphohydrolase